MKDEEADNTAILEADRLNMVNATKDKEKGHPIIIVLALTEGETLVTMITRSEKTPVGEDQMIMIEATAKEGVKRGMTFFNLGTSQHSMKIITRSLPTHKNNKNKYSIKSVWP